MISKIVTAAERFALTRRRSLIAIQLLALYLMVAVAAANAQAQKKDIEINPALGSPEVQITKVTNRGIVGDDATLVIRVEWSARARQTIEFLSFIASVEVEYADGSKNSSNAQSVGATARQADLRVLNKGANAPRKFTARLTTQFNFLDLNFINTTEEFTLNQSNGFQAAPPASGTPRPSGEAFAISRVQAKFTDCAPAKHCFIIDWGITPRASVQLGQVNLNGEITYHPGTQIHNAVASANATARTATLLIEEPKGKFDSVKIRLTAKVAATLTLNKTTQLSGSF
jgi:hypothetical protein